MQHLLRQGRIDRLRPFYSAWLSAFRLGFGLLPYPLPLFGVAIPGCFAHWNFFDPAPFQQEGINLGIQNISRLVFRRISHGYLSTMSASVGKPSRDYTGIPLPAYEKRPTIHYQGSGINIAI